MTNGSNFVDFTDNQDFSFKVNKMQHFGSMKNTETPMNFNAKFGFQNAPSASLGGSPTPRRVIIVETSPRSNQNIRIHGSNGGNSDSLKLKPKKSSESTK